LATRLAFLVAGFGVACRAPLVPFAEERLQVDDGIMGLLLLCLGLGSLATAGYAGILVGPAGIGFVAKTAGLLVAFWLLALLVGAVVLSARSATARPPTLT
jgi:hypothetical protein